MPALLPRRAFAHFLDDHTGLSSTASRACPRKRTRPIASNAAGRREEDNIIALTFFASETVGFRTSEPRQRLRIGVIAALWARTAFSSSQASRRSPDTAVELRQQSPSKERSLVTSACAFNAARRLALSSVER